MCIEGRPYHRGCRMSIGLSGVGIDRERETESTGLSGVGIDRERERDREAESTGLSGVGIDRERQKRSNKDRKLEHQTS